MRHALPDEPFRFRMGVSRGSAAAYFGVRADDAEAIAERRAIVAADAMRVVCLDDAAPLVDEAIATLRASGVVEDVPDGTTHAKLVWLSGTLAPDLLLLDDASRLVAAAVCFPSSWSLDSKIGRPLAEVHAPVPGLEGSLGNSIARFLAGMKAGDAFLRSGFGLSASDARDQHPARRLPRLSASPRDDETFVRIEDQALVKLPNTAGVLFGIRIRHTTLRALESDPIALRGLAHAVATMPDEVAEYKGLGRALPSLRERLAHRVRALSADERIA